MLLLEFLELSQTHFLLLVIQVLPAERRVDEFLVQLHTLVSTTAHVRLAECVLLRYGIQKLLLLEWLSNIVSDLLSIPGAFDGVVNSQTAIEASKEGLSHFLEVLPEDPVVDSQRLFNRLVHVQVLQSYFAWFQVELRLSNERVLDFFAELAAEVLANLGT